MTKASVTGADDQRGGGGAPRRLVLVAADKFKGSLTAVEVADRLCVEIFDDGVGLDTSQARSGLVNLSGRASRRGGRLDIEPRSPGAALRWVVPLPAHTQGEQPETTGG